MRTNDYAFCFLAGTVFVAPAWAGEKPDIDTSPRTFASANGKYWVRVTTKREIGDVNKWTTTLTVSHAEGGNADKVLSTTTLDTFPDRILVSDKGDMTVLGHFDGIGWEGIITVYGDDGKRRGSTKFMEFLEPLARGAQRTTGEQNLRYGKGATYQYYSTDFLVIPLTESRVARLSLETGRPAE
jgi:hypothetical protein